MKKTKLTTEEIIQISNLANIKLTGNELKKIEKQLTETLDYVQNLNEIKTDKTNPANNTIDFKNQYFGDGEDNKRNLNHKEVFGNTKFKKGNFFSVKKIL